MSIKPRDYQQDAIFNLRASYAAANRSPLLVLPTGGGKTAVFSFVTVGAVARGNRVLILVHREELLDQGSASLAGFGVSHGMIAPGYPFQPGERVQVASVQTVVRRFHRLAAADWRPDLIVIDEAHHAVAGSWRKVTEHWPAARVLGVTATPCRMDGAGLVDVFDDMVEGPQICELIGRGYLAPPEVYAPPVVAELGGLPTRGGDFARDVAADRMDKPTVTGDAISHYSRICPGAPAIAFCVSVAHAEHVAAEFRARGWQAASLDGTMAKADRRDRIRDLADGRLHVLTSCDLISEGTDIPVVTAAIKLRPTKSLGLELQQTGRVLRPIYAPGYDLSTDEGRLAAIAAGPKPAAIILDHVGNVKIHGLPDEPREWTLAGRAKGSRAAADGPPPPVDCGECFRQIRRPLPPACPHCGALIKAQADRMASLEYADGELRKVDEVAAREIARQRRIEQGMASSMSELAAIGAARGYKNPQKWAWKVWSNKRNRTNAAATI
jgi:DNA repair protein RadD